MEKSPNIAKGVGDSLKTAPAGAKITGKTRKYYKNRGNRQLRHLGKLYLLREDPDAQLLEPVEPGYWS